MLGVGAKIELEHATITYTDFGCAVDFHDGGHIEAWPHDTHHYHVISHRLGYGDDIMAYCRHHEFAHEFVAERIMGDVSHVLHTLAWGREQNKGLVTYEEIMAQTFQRWLQANERPIISGVKWDRLKEEALDLLSSG